MNLKDKKVLITGSTGGIGYNLVKTFSDLGAIILATGTNKEKLDKLKNEFYSVLVLGICLHWCYSSHGWISLSYL